MKVVVDVYVSLRGIHVGVGSGGCVRATYCACGTIAPEFLYTLKRSEWLRRSFMLILGSH